jgi:hypothetical protein
MRSILLVGAIVVVGVATSCGGGQREEGGVVTLPPSLPTVTASLSPAPSPPAVPEVVGPDAVWFPGSQNYPEDPGSCYRDQSCMYGWLEDRGASPAAISFFLSHNAFLVRFWDLGKVDLALIRWPWFADTEGYRWLLVNGTPEVDPSLLLPADLTGSLIIALGPYATEEVRKGYASIAAAIGTGAMPRGPQWNAGVVESALSRPDGGQSFIFEYVIGQCPNCDSGYRYRVQFDFGPGGVEEGWGSVLPPCGTEPGGNLGKRVPGLAPSCPSPFLVPWEQAGLILPGD